MSSFVVSILNDDFYSKITESFAFQRLKNISFLGAINYAWPCARSVKSLEKTRYMHSLHVASLAKYISDKRNLDKETEKHVVTAALLHDIGHSPLSHSIEPAFKHSWGIEHHQIGREIILGKREIGKNLFRTLNRNLNINSILDLIDGTGQESSGDMFISPINIDTIDGITRSYNLLSNSKAKTYCPIKIAYASFLKKDNETEKTLDDFWNLKNSIYNLFISEDRGIKSDLICQIYFKENKSTFNQSDWLETEKNWRKKHSKLFELLEQVKSNKINLHNLEERELTITKRTYQINTSATLQKHSNSIYERYLCKKHEKNYTFPLQKITSSFQGSLFP